MLRFLGFHFEVLVYASIYLGTLNYAVGYFYIKQPDIFSGSEEKEFFQDKYAKSSLKERQVTELKDKLIRIMNVDKVFMDPGLSALVLSKKLNINTHILSELLNQHFNQNFYDFINQYRVEEAKKRLKDKEYNNFTVLAIGMDVGFNSKSTFNSVFKKVAGVTPSEFRTIKIQAA